MNDPFKLAKLLNPRVDEYDGKEKVMKHTPGPWKVDERVGCIAIYPENETFNCLDQPRQNFIAYWSGYRDENGTWQVYKKDQANARIIAAAPDLLEACKDAEEIYSELFVCRPKPTIGLDRAITSMKRIRQAISKAEE